MKATSAMSTTPTSSTPPMASSRQSGRALFAASPRVEPAVERFAAGTLAALDSRSSSLGHGGEEYRRNRSGALAPDLLGGRIVHRAPVPGVRRLPVPSGGAMTTGEAPRRRENAFTLVRRLVSGGVTLAKLEVQRGRQEMARNLGQLKGGVLRLAIAAALAVIFLIGLARVHHGRAGRDRPVVGGADPACSLLVLVAGLLAWSGIRRVTSTKFTPEETIAAVKEDVEWAKNRLLRRG